MLRNLFLCLLELRSVLLTFDICYQDHTSATQDQDAPGIPDPYDRHDASTRQITKDAGPQEGRYRPIRSKTVIDRLQTTK